MQVLFKGGPYMKKYGSMHDLVEVKILYHVIIRPIRINNRLERNWCTILENKVARAVFQVRILEEQLIKNSISTYTVRVPL